MSLFCMITGGVKVAGVREYLKTLEGKILCYAQKNDNFLIFGFFNSQETC